MNRVCVVLAGLFLLSVSMANVQANDIRTLVKGKWEITIPDAPSGYDKYEVEFKEKDGVIVLDSKSSDFTIREQKFTLRDGRLVTNLYVGETIQIVVWEEKGVVKGSADTSMGKLPVVFKKK